MSEDFISNNFAENINKQIIRRNIKLLLFILILFSLYIVLDFAEWFPFIYKASSFPDTNLNFYNYKIRPLIVLMCLPLNIAVWFFYLKGHKLILQSFEKDNADIFNKGYSFLFKVSILNIIGYSIFILSSIIRFVLKYSA
jgi:hypothetical protein